MHGRDKETGRQGEREKSSLRERNINIKNVIFSTLIIVLLFQSCSVFNSQNSTNEITVVASASFSNALDEIAKAFTAKTRINVITSYDATANLAKQIESGAPYDVFASADVEAIVKLRKVGLIIQGSEKIFARGSLVLWLPPQSQIKISKLDDLLKPEITRIAIANPETAPYGRASIDALKHLNLYEKLKDKIIYGQNVTQAKQYAETGNVDVAFVALSIMKDKQGTIIEVDEKLHEPLDNSIAVLKDSKSLEAAQRFVDFVLSDEGRAILKKYGYK